MKHIRLICIKLCKNLLASTYLEISKYFEIYIKELMEQVRINKTVMAKQCI